MRLAWAYVATRAPVGPIVNGDPFFYFEYGRRLAHGLGYDNYFTGQPTAYYPIGYPLVLASVFWVAEHLHITRDLPWVGSVFQAVVGTASVGLVFVIARRLFDFTTGVVGAALYAFFPNPIFYVATLHLETVFVCLLLTATAVLVTHDWTSGPPSRNRSLVFGATLGVSALVRPFSLPLLAAYLVSLVVAQSGWRTALSRSAWATLAVGLVLAPWIGRNAVRLHSPVLSTNMGDTLCIDRYDGSDGRFRFVDAAGGCAPANEPEAERNTDNIRASLRWVRAHPLDELRLVGLRAWRMMENDHDGLPTAAEGGNGGAVVGPLAQSVLTWVADLYFFGTVVLAIIGVACLPRWSRPETVFVLLAAGTMLAVPLVLWGSTRFHAPLLPFVAIFAAAPLVRFKPDSTPNPSTPSSEVQPAAPVRQRSSTTA